MSYYHHELDFTNSASRDGESAETLFAKLFEEKYNRPAVATTLQENKYEHKDFKIIGNDNKEYAVDVKSIKHKSRHDSEYSEDIIWVEFVVKGNPGWLYGKADYIAFMTPDRKGFLCVNREELKEWCQEHVKAEIVTSSYDALYKLYVRNQPHDVHDVISMIKYSDLLTLSKNWWL